jgi:hypothetical protein
VLASASVGKEDDNGGRQCRGRSNGGCGTNSEQFCVGASNDLVDLRLDLDLKCDIVFECHSERGLDDPNGQRETGESATREGPQTEVGSGGREGVAAV